MFALNLAWLSLLILPLLCFKLCFCVWWPILTVYVQQVFVTRRLSGKQSCFILLRRFFTFQSRGPAVFSFLQQLYHRAKLQSNMLSSVQLLDFKSVFRIIRWNFFQFGTSRSVFHRSMGTFTAYLFLRLVAHMGTLGRRLESIFIFLLFWKYDTFQIEKGSKFCNFGRPSSLSSFNFCQASALLTYFSVSTEFMARKTKVFVAARLRSLRTDDRSSEGHPRSVKQELETWKHLKFIHELLDS